MFRLFVALVFALVFFTLAALIEHLPEHWQDWLLSLFD
jgi:hypothetical protein